jgi:indole-3-glycerol phosphate synthase
VPRAQECVIAVNNSDIADRERGPADVNRSVDLLAAVRATGTRCPVSASGISEPAVAAELLNIGYSGLLIGTGLLRAGNVGEWMAAFRALR